MIIIIKKCLKMSANYIGLILTLSIVTATATEPPPLTPLIKKQKFEEARNLTGVDPTYFLNLTSYSGHITVDPKYNSNIFFWYFPVVNKPVNKTPIIVWLQGGPGSTSLYGLFDEFGPFSYDDKEDKLKLRQWSWLENFSLLFIDNPVGTGYSFTDGPDEAYVKDMDTCAEHLYMVIQNFLLMFPELRETPLYIAGESYAGHYVPAIGVRILQSADTSDLKINLQGLMMGNPMLDRRSVSNYTEAFYKWGIIDLQGVQAVKPVQDQYTQAVLRGDNALTYDLREKLLSRLEDLTSVRTEYNVLKDGYSIGKFVTYLNKPEVRAALHVQNTPEAEKSKVQKNLIPDILSPVQPKLEALLEHYRIMIYCGQLDLMAPCVQSAEAPRRSWHWSHHNDFMKAPRTPWAFGETVAGYVKSGGGLTEVLVRGAGHLVPIEKPAEAQELISYFIRGLDFPVPSNYQVNSDFTPDLESVSPTDGTHIGMIVSIVLNVLLVIGMAGVVIYFYRWKRRQQNLFYNLADTDSINSNDLLSMS